MIVKKVKNPKKSAGKAERIGKLTNYIASPETENGLEKCIHHEGVNFLTSTLAGQTAEMIALAEEAVKSKDPVDHWVLSWQADEKPTTEQVREAVAMFIGHCKLEGHQYMWALHDDTENLHAHIVLNRVNQDTIKVAKINKGFDLEAAHQAIAIIEHAQGWRKEEGARYDIDVKSGKTIKREQDPAKQINPTSVAQAMEVQTGEKSAQRIGIETAAPIIANATSWKELHQRLEAEGMKYERKGSGAIVHVGDVPVKASDVSRAASLSAMQKRLGPYQPSHEINKNDYHDTNRNFRAAKANEPHIAALGKNTGNGLRSLSQCTLAHSGKGPQASRTRVLQLDARPDRPGAGGLRRDTGRVDDIDVHAEGRTGISSANREEGRRGIARTSENDQAAGRDGEKARATGTKNSASPDPDRNQGPGSRGSSIAGRNVRLGSGGGQRRPVALKDGQPGWKEYIAIRDTQKAAKSHDTTALQKRHGAERSELAAKLKAERSETLAGNWKGKGELWNAMQSVLATQQGAAELELSERHRIERKDLQARYKPLPVYKQWKEQPLIVGLVVLPLIDQHIERDRQPPALAQMLRSLSHNIDSRNHITYQFAGKAVFRDEGRTIQILDMKSDQGIAAALVTAQQKFGNVLTLTGSPEFQQNAVAIAVANGLTCRFADPQLDALRAQLQAEKYASERAAARNAAERLAAAEKAATEPLKADHPPLTQSNKSREAGLLTEPEHLAPTAETVDAIATPSARDARADIEQLAADNELAKPEGRRNPVIEASENESSQHAGTIIAVNDKYVVIEEQGRTTIHSLERLRIQTTGKAAGLDAIAPGNAFAAVYKRDEKGDGQPYAKVEVTEKRQEYQRERSNGLGR